MRRVRIMDGCRLKLGDRGLEVENRDPVEESPAKHLERLRREAESWRRDRGHRVAEVWRKRYDA